jgi:uncharacterized cupredoxin-like copper-binding protein
LRPFIGALVVTIFTIGGCSDDGIADPGDSGLRVINASDFTFGKDVVEVPSGSDVTIRVRNSGSLEHTWTVLAAGVQVATAEDVSASSILFTVSVKPAQSTEVPFSVPAAGSYQVICTVPGHLEAGMTATLESIASGDALDGRS